MLTFWCSCRELTYLRCRYQGHVRYAVLLVAHDLLELHARPPHTHYKLAYRQIFSTPLPHIIPQAITLGIRLARNVGIPSLRTPYERTCDLVTVKLVHVSTCIR